MNACPTGESLNITAKSPAPTTTGDEPSMDGNGKTSASVPGTAVVSLTMLVRTKSPSNSMPASGGSRKTSGTVSSKLVCTAPRVPPARFWESPITTRICSSASITEGSVQGISWAASWSYISGPAVRM